MRLGSVKAPPWPRRGVRTPNPLYNLNNNMTSTGTAGPYINVINENYKKIYG